MKNQGNEKVSRTSCEMGEAIGTILREQIHLCYAYCFNNETQISNSSLFVTIQVVFE